MFAEIASIAGPLLSGMMGSDSADNAADTQAASTREAIAEQRRQYDLNRADTADYRDTGSAAIRRLRDLAVLGGAGGAGGPSQSSSASQDPKMRAAIQLANRDALAGRGYALTAEELADPNKQKELQAIIASFDTNADNRKVLDSVTEDMKYEGPALSRRFGERDLAKDTIYNQSGIVKAAQGINPSDLTRKFTIADFYADPVVKLGMDFGLSEGTKAIDRGAGAAGLRNSGQTLKALTKFGTDYAGGMAEGSNARFLAERGNLKDLLGYKDMMASGAEDSFVKNQDRTYSQLAGAAGIGSGATNANASTGTGISGNIANLISAGGNARAAAGIAGGNAWGNAFNTIGNWWNQNQMLDKLQNMQRGASSVNPYPVSWAFGSSGDR